LLAVLSVLSVGGIVWAAATTSESNLQAERLAAIRALPPEEQSRLLANKERFDRLPEAEQERLRDVQARIAAEADAEDLRGVLERYDQWLAELTFADSSSVRSLPPDQRVEQIKKLRQKQSQEQLEWQERERGLTNQDWAALRRWWADLVRRNEAQLLAKLPARERDMLSRVSADRRQQSLEWMAIAERGKHARGKRVLEPTRADLEQLVASLSPPARERLERVSPPEARFATVVGWLKSDFRRRFKSSIAPYVDAKELTRFGREELRPEEYTRLEDLPKDERRRELSKRYFKWKWDKRQPRGPSPHGSSRQDGDHHRPGPHGPRPWGKGPHDNRPDERPGGPDSPFRGEAPPPREELPR
jgi:hypothetical protein